MKTIFLASGRSSRMSPISDKSLLGFCGKPLCIHLLQNAQKAGLKDFIVVVNKTNKSSIEKLLKEYDISGKTILQPDLDDGMAGGIEAGLTLVDDKESVVLLGGNDYVEQRAYADIINTLKSSDGALLSKKVETYFPGGYIEKDDSNTITNIIEKPGAGKEPSPFVNIVIHGFTKARDLKGVLKNTIKNQGDSYEKALQSLFTTKTIKAVLYNGVWQAIKYPWHVLDMMDILLKETLNGKEKVIDSSIEIADTARIRGENIIIEKGVKVSDNAVIQGPCYIGENSIIGNNALVRQSHIGKNSTVGYNTEVARTYFHKDITTHIAYVGDSIVDKGVNFGAFSTTANLRLDKKTIPVLIKEERINSNKEKLGAIIGQDAQIGIHALLMPGTKINPEESIFPGSLQK